MKLNKKKTVKAQVEEKLDEFENKLSELVGLSYHYHARGIRYQYITQTSVPSALIILSIVALIVSIVTMTPIIGFSIEIGAIFGATVSICCHNRMARKQCENRIGFVTICFYTKRLLNEVCEQIALVDEDIEVAKATKAERDRKAAEAREEKIRMAGALRRPFDELFKIIRDELDGEVKGSGENGELLDTDTNVELKLPYIANDHLEFAWHTFSLTEDGFDKLAFWISQVRPFMISYHSLKKSLDTAVPTEQ